MSVSTILFSHLSSLQTLTSELWDHQQMDGWIFSPAWCTALNKMSAEALSGRHHFFWPSRMKLDRSRWTVWVLSLCEAWAADCARVCLAASSQAWEVNNLQCDCCDLYRTAVEGGSNQSISSQSLSANRQRPIYFVVFSVADGCAFWRAPNTAACL